MNSTAPNIVLDYSPFGSQMPGRSFSPKKYPQALSAISNFTGFSLNTIEQDFQSGNGPTINILPIGGGAKGGESGIIFDPSMIKSLANIDGNDLSTLSEQTLGVALTIIHEYVHYGDQITNDGNNSGQYIERKIENSTGGANIFRKQYSEIFKGNNIDIGKQKWKTSLTGHRGTDVEVAGFGVEISVNDDGSNNIEPSSYSKTTSNSNIPKIPSSLPKEAKGETILKTLDVK